MSIDMMKSTYNLEPCPGVSLLLSGCASFRRGEGKGLEGKGD